MRVLDRLPVDQVFRTRQTNDAFPPIHPVFAGDFRGDEAAAFDARHNACRFVRESSVLAFRAQRRAVLRPVNQVF